MPSSVRTLTLGLDLSFFGDSPEANNLALTFVVIKVSLALASRVVGGAICR